MPSVMVRRSQAYVSEANLDATADEWLRIIRGRVAPRPRLELDPSRCALLVIDAQRYFLHRQGRCFLPAAAAVVPRVARLLEAWRRLNATVAFTRHGHAGTGDLGMLGRFYSDYIRRGEPDAEILDELAPRRGERVIDKTTYDAFIGTDLEAALRRAGSEQILVTGALTHLCCETTARAAFCRGFEVYLAVDATASSTERLHLGALAGLADGVAVLMSSREILRACAARISS